MLDALLMGNVVQEIIRRLRTMILISLLLAALSDVCSSQAECGCQTPIFSRQPCSAYPFSPSRTECLSAGCCWNSAFLSFGPKCYQKDSNQCLPASTAPPIQGGNCLVAQPLRQCGFGFDKISCEFNNCCYRPDIPPFCFTRASSIRPTFRPLGQQVSEWSAWSDCSTLCSAGTQSRTRQCLSTFGCASQGLNLRETQTCNSGICQNWTPWYQTSCSVTCGDGEITNYRNCWGFGTRGPTECHSVTTACRLAACPAVVPVFRQPLAFWGQWQAWGDCDNLCGPGARHRTRQCFINGASVGLERCREGFNVPLISRQSEECNVNLCSVWGTWTPYSECSQTCGTSSVRFSSRSCIVPPVSDTNVQPFRECANRDQPCEVPRCPRTPHQGSIFRTTDITSPPTTSEIFSRTVSEANTPDSKNILGHSTSAATQSTSSIPVEGQTFEIDWLTTTPLPTAGPVNQLTSSTLPKTTTVKPFTTTSVSETTANETLAFLQTWSSWSPCSTTCGDGTSLRVRQCLYRNGTEAPNGLHCGVEHLAESVECYEGPCQVSITPPTETTPTTEHMTTVLTTATQSLATEAMSSSRPADTTTTIVDEQTAEWESWKPWSDCSSTCSPGLRVRSRACKYRNGVEDLDPLKCNAEDPGSMFGEEPCNVDLCPRWNKWRFTACSVTCDRGPDEPPGIKLRRRRCVESEGKVAGENCYLVAELCNATKPCVDATTEVTSASSSSSLPPTKAITTTLSTSTTSTTTTVVTTSIEPTPSPTSMTSSSSTRPSGDIWAEWGEWSKCSSPCAPGLQNRVRRCLEGVSEESCVEGQLISRECNQLMCTGWSQWRTTPCDKTCGDGGTQLRRRICLSGQPTESMPESCHSIREPCAENPPCKDQTLDKKFDILFLIDSSSHVDDCPAIQEKSNVLPPIRRPQLTDKIAPTYARMKKFILDFVDGWRGISNDGTRVSLQLISGLCNSRTRANLYVEKRFNETHELLKEYIAEMPYLCGDFWLDWTMQCTYSPVMTEKFGDRKDVPNAVVAILSHVPTASLPRDALLRRILKRLESKAKVLSATASRLEDMGPISKQKYLDHTRRIACKDGASCPAYLGSIWDLETSEVAEKIRDALREPEKS